MPVKINAMRNLFTFSLQGRTEVWLRSSEKKTKFPMQRLLSPGRLAAEVTAEDQKHLPEGTLGIPSSVHSVQLVIPELGETGLSSVQQRRSLLCLR